ncbi:Sec20-like protein [Plasmodium cynomolgi strain B]|uniref:Sec20-like protein n=1 Tax=Plasmodium cynomolgi (strain B) TaxID=1120755 RepID=K6UMR4_PLACD|nr:Sec20-like protein [Plasmodium cynomolgi strain B]GAB68833.1 Sec20-like protein [Plasmodium cynomolgi strain B]
MKKAFLPNLGKKNENVETLSKISSMINHMKLIDDSLKNLFLSEDDLNSHDAFLLFRGKVAKRIVHYSNLAAECKDKILCAEVSDEDAEDIKQQFEYHQGNVESDDHGTFSESEEKKQTDANLKDTKQMMIDEINRMKSVRSELLESSHKLRKQDQIFNMFESKIKSSTQLLFSLKKKAQNDTRYVWYSFFFFLSVCSYIIMRRLGVIWALITVIKLLLSLMLYLVKLALGMFHFVKKGNEEKGANGGDDLGKTFVPIPVTTEL